MLGEDEDSYTSNFLAINKEGLPEFNQAIFAKVCRLPTVSEPITAYVLLQVNKEKELSYIDDVLMDTELEVDDVSLDQKEKSLELNWNVDDVPTESVLKVATRLCYSAKVFLHSLLSDIEALIAKEQEYDVYLNGC